MVADEAEATFRIEAIAVEGDDAGRLLATVLKGVKPERGDGCGIEMTEDTEDAAFLAQAISLGIVVYEGIGCPRFQSRHGGHHYLVAPKQPIGLLQL